MSKASDFFGGGGGEQKFQEFTSSGTWTHPDPGAVVHLLARIVGGGAGGENATGTTGVDAGGGGETNEHLISVTGDIDVFPGAGGSGGASGGDNAGSTGGDSYITASTASFGKLQALGGGRRYTSGSSGLNTANLSAGGGFQQTTTGSGEKPSMPYGNGQPGAPGGTDNESNTGLPTQYADAGATSGSAGGGGASFGNGGDGNDTASTKAGNGSAGGGGGASQNDGGGGDGGDGVVQLFWRE